MIKYFKELLATLKSINSQLVEISDNTRAVSNCVKVNTSRSNDRFSLSTKDRNSHL